MSDKKSTTQPRQNYTNNFGCGCGCYGHKNLSEPNKKKLI